MRKICKNINIALIFMLIGVFLWQDFAYGLRPPLRHSSIKEEFTGSQDEQVVKVFKLFQELAAQIEIAIYDSNVSQQINKLREWCDKKGDKDTQKVCKLIKNIIDTLQNDILVKIYKITRPGTSKEVYFGKEIGLREGRLVTYDFVDKWAKLIMVLGPVMYNKTIAEECSLAFIHNIDAYIGLLRDIRSPGGHILEVAGNMSESEGEPEYTYRFLAHYYGIIHRISSAKTLIAAIETDKHLDENDEYAYILRQIIDFGPQGKPTEASITRRNLIASIYPNAVAALSNFIKERYPDANTNNLGVSITIQGSSAKGLAMDDSDLEIRLLVDDTTLGSGIKIDAKYKQKMIVLVLNLFNEAIIKEGLSVRRFSLKMDRTHKVTFISEILNNPDRGRYVKAIADIFYVNIGNIELMRSKVLRVIISLENPEKKWNQIRTQWAGFLKVSFNKHKDRIGPGNTSIEYLRLPDLETICRIYGVDAQQLSLHNAAYPMKASREADSFL
jgi:hypothetical protein